MRKVLVLVVMALASSALAATYYVSSSTGDDGNPGTQAQPWKTLGGAGNHVNGGTFVPGDTILLKRGDVWNESLIPPSSGASGSPITFDAYGTGAPPEISGKRDLSGWTLYSTNVWSAPVTTGSVAYAIFNSVWGQKQAALGSILHDRDFMLYNNALLAYSPSATNPATYYGTVSAIVPLNASGSDQGIYVNGKIWLTFQHIRLSWYENLGVYVAGASDHLVFANMEADGMVPAGNFPHGFYVNAPGATDIRLYNDAAHLNYDGIRVDGVAASATATAVTVTNCAGYANRDSALVDNTGGHLTYSYSHFYANGTGGIESIDVVGAVAGSGSIAADTAPSIQSFARYPARFSFTVDDVGLYAGSDSFVDALIPVFNARGLKMNAAVVTGATGVSYSTSDVASWVAGGHEVDSHSWSHQYFTDPAYLSTNHIYNSANPTPATAFSLRYIGTGTAATLSVSGGLLTTTVSGGPGGENLNVNLATPAYDTLEELTSYISNNYPGAYSVVKWTTSPQMRGAAHSVTLANLTAQDIKTAAFGLQFDPTRAVTGLMADEAVQSRTWLQSNISGLSNVKVYVYPDGVTDPGFEAAVVAAGYEGARGTLSMCGSGMGPCSGPNAFVSYATGVNAQNITSLTPFGWTNYANLTQPQIEAKVAALIFRARAWGYPVGLFVHGNDYPDSATAATKTGWLLDSIIAHGGTVTRTDAMIEAVLGMSQISGTTKYVTPAGGSVNLAPLAASATTRAGTNLGAAYNVDLLGNPRGSAWDSGAYQTLWSKHGSGSGAGYFRIGSLAGTGTSENVYCGAGDVPRFGSTDGPATLPTACTYTAMSGTPSPGAVTTVASDCSDLQTKITAAAAGDTIVIPAVATCAGHYTLPVKSGADINHWVTIRTDQIANSNFPPEGQQATPCQINLTHLDTYPNFPCPTPGVRMPTITANANNSPAIQPDTGAAFYRLIGLNIAKSTGVMMVNFLVSITSADHIIIDRCLIHGDPNMDYLTKAGVGVRGTHLAVINSWVYDIDYNSPDGYAIGGGTGTQLDEGPTKLYGNLLQGASETWLWGGGAAAVTPHDIEIRRNLSIHPLKHYTSIMNNYGGGGNPHVAVKNNGEFKNGIRVLYEDNVAWGSWQGQADQPGSMWLLTPSNQSNQVTFLYVNTNGTAISCAANSGGTPCAAGAGWFAQNITSGSRTANTVTLNASVNALGWPYGWSAGNHVVVQGLTGTCASFNGEQVTTSNTSGVVQFTLAGADIASCGSTTGAILQDLTASNCAPHGCRFGLTGYPKKHIVSVQDSEHITIAEDLGINTGSTHKTCRPGLAPGAQLRDMTIRYNYLTHAAATGMGLTSGTSDCQDEGLGSSNVSIHDNAADDIDARFWTNYGHSCCAGGVGTGLKLSSSNTQPSAWQHDMLYAHNTIAGIRTWGGGGLQSGFFSYTDALNANSVGLTLLRVSNVVTITMSSVPFIVGDQVTVNGFIGTYAAINGQRTITAITPTSVSFSQTGADISPAITIASGTTGSGVMVPYPLTYAKNLTVRDNIGPGPFNWTVGNGNTVPGGLTAGLALNACDYVSPYTCTWHIVNNLLGLTLYSGETQLTATPYPTTNPDSSPTCTVGAGCTVADFSGVFVNWNTGLGNVTANDYHVAAASPYHNTASDGKDFGANMDRIATVKAAVLPSFTWNPLVIATTALTACTNGVYCEQQLTISSGASGPNGYVRWKLVSGTVPTGMTFEADGQNYVNGTWRHSSTGNAGWLWGTPTTPGSYPMTFQAEDAAHQTASASVTLVVN
jgi:hypothetical protein